MRASGTASLFRDLPKSVVDKRKKAPQPLFLPVMLATLTVDYFDSPEWIFEHKFDGERCLAVKKDGEVHLMSRNRKEMKEKYPELAAAIKQQKADNFIIDGEIVALKQGESSFELLQARINLQNPAEVARMETTVPIKYRVFDVLYAGGYDLQELPLYARKSVLEKLLAFNDIITLTAYEPQYGIELYKKACAMHWEGLIAKRSASPYVGERSRDWLKFKCIIGQELVIGGYTDPQRSRTDFGALLVGYYDHDKLRYAGKVGTGFTEETLALLGKKLRKLEAKTCPFSDYDGRASGVHWVRPELVADFKFAEWTKAGRLRVPRYKGLREDKNAQDVVKEVPRTHSSRLSFE
jgi:bifunctional non-homologous end joining protein LigD